MNDLTIELQQRCVYVGCVEEQEVEDLAPQDDPNASGSAALLRGAKEIAGELGGDINRRVVRSYVDGRALGGSTTAFLETILIAFGASGAAMTFLKYGKEVLLRWMANSSQRSVRLKSGEFEVELKGSEDFDRAAELLRTMISESSPGSELNQEAQMVAAARNHQPQAECWCCVRGTPVGGPRVCPECGHAFRGNGWDGIDAHWRAHHEEVMPYEDFWSSLCDDHRGHGRRPQ